MYTDRELLLEIDVNRENLEKFNLARCVRRVLEAESNMHSNKIEHPPRVTHSRKNRKRIADEIHQTLQDLTEAWTWASANFNGEFNHSFIQDVAKRIEPLNPRVLSGYRQDAAYITGEPPTCTPNYIKIPNLMGELFALVNDVKLHAVDRAVLMHFHVARIHPFVDGNGRTARLLQNLILRDC